MTTSAGWSISATYVQVTRRVVRAAWLLLPDGTIDHFYSSYSSALDHATMRPAQGRALRKALVTGSSGTTADMVDRAERLHGDHQPKLRSGGLYRGL